MKHLVFIISTFIIGPVTLLYYLVNAAIPGNTTFSGFTQLLSLLPGRTGNYLRLGFYCFTLKNCDREVVISFLAQFAQQDTELYSGVYIGPQCNIGSCVISKNTLLGSGVHIMSGKSQHFFDDLDRPIKDQGGKYEKISIGENCWIGNGALVMANVGDHSIIAAGSVVIDDIPDYSIAAGNPAKVLKSRN